MALVAAKCTECGAAIEVEDTKDAGICNFCGTAFITQKVIHVIKQENSEFLSSLALAESMADIFLLRGPQAISLGNKKGIMRYWIIILWRRWLVVTSPHIGFHW